MQTIVLTALVITLAGGTLAFLFERQAEEATITSIEDAIWWAFVTSTTVGYGDAYPVTAAERGIAIALMLLGIAALSAVTASVAAFLTREDQGTEQPDVALFLERLDDLKAEIALLRHEQANHRPL